MDKNQVAKNRAKGIALQRAYYLWDDALRHPPKWTQQFSEEDESLIADQLCLLADDLWERSERMLKKYGAPNPKGIAP